MAVWDAGRAYHAECTRGPSWHQTYASIPSPHGQARVLRQLNEEDVRRIVREEMAKTPNVTVQGQDEAQLRTVPLERPVGRKEE